MPRYDLLITGGMVLDPASGHSDVADIAIVDGKIARVEPEIDHDMADHVVDVTGSWVMPGMIDTHVHVAGRRPTWDPALGFRMLALAGVTSAIDFGGTPETLIDGIQRKGAGLNVGGLHIFRPGETIPHDDPPPHEIRDLVSDSLARGALGVKMLGFAAAASLYNAMNFPDEEEELSEYERRQMHLILGRRDDGTIMTVRVQGAFSDALSWFDLQDQQ